MAGTVTSTRSATALILAPSSMSATTRIARHRCSDIERVPAGGARLGEGHARAGDELARGPITVEVWVTAAQVPLG